MPYSEHDRNEFLHQVESYKQEIVKSLNALGELAADPNVSRLAIIDEAKTIFEDVRQSPLADSVSSELDRLKEIKADFLPGDLPINQVLDPNYWTGINLPSRLRLLKWFVSGLKMEHLP